MPSLFRWPGRGHTRSYRTGLVQITITAVLWGSGGVVAQLLHEHAGLDPVAIAFYRLAVAAPLLCIVALRRRAVARRRLPWVPLMVTGVGLGAYQALYYAAVSDVGVAVATMISIGLGPVTIMLGRAVLRREAPALNTAFTLTTAIFGLALVTSGGLHQDSGPHPWLGLVCATGSGLGYAMTTALGRRLTATVDPATLAATTTIVGATALAPAATTVGLGFALTARSVMGLSYLGPMTTAVGFVLFYRGLATTDTGTASVIILLEPLAAVILAAVVLRQGLPAATLAGGVVMLTAIATLYRSQEPT